MAKKIRVAIAGVGNCASALVQGINYYHANRTNTRLKTYDTVGNDNNPKDIEGNTEGESVEHNAPGCLGLTAYNLGGYEPDDVDFVAAFDVIDSKVGKDLSQAIFAEPNNTVFTSNVDKMDVKVQKAEVLDGIGEHYHGKVSISNESFADVAATLKDRRAEILLNYLPVGSRQATQFYVEKCLESGVCFINAIPVFIASSPKWQQAFDSKGVPCAGDDVMSQIGATVLHKTLAKLFVDRGVNIDETYQLNIGGDMDFYNMLDEDRLEDKRISKTSAVAAMAPYNIPMRIGPSDYVSFLKNDKISYIYLRGKYFGNIPVEVDLKLRVVDAYNSAGIMIDAIRGAKVALRRGISGSLESVSAYCFKHPPKQMSYNQAKKNFIDFVEGRIEK
jgi:myo-inositol-1-phosphate synthase